MIAAPGATETTKSGNCLYEAANIQLDNPPETTQFFRRMGAQFIRDNSHIVAIAGLNLDDVIRTISTPGVWAADAGDLAPVVLASVVQRQLIIVQNDTVFTVEPFGGAVGDPLTMYLNGNHYTVHPVTDAQRNQAALKKEKMAIKGSPKKQSSSSKKKSKK